MNVAHLLVNSTHKYPDRTAIISGETRLTFKVFNARVNRLADAMGRLGVMRGERVALMFYNTHHFAEVYFATVKLGALATPVNFRFVGEEIEYIIENSEAGFFFFGKDFEETIGNLCHRLSGVRIFVGVEASKGGFASDYEGLLVSGNPHEPSVAIAEEDPCQVMYTSGTTGKPKGAIITHGNVLWNLINTILGREDRPGEVSLIIGPLYHTAALNNHFTIQVALGGTSILVKRFDPEAVLRCIEGERVNVISGSPAMYRLLLQHPRLRDYGTQSITKCTAGAAILPHELKKKLLEVFPKAEGVYDVYGCTEASPTITILSGRDSFRKHGSVGPAVPFVQARVVDQEGRSLPAEEVGELVCKGPNVMKGYYRNREATRETIRDGWLYTGDLAKVDDEGYYYIVDRKKDMIVSGGENIYPRELEEVLFKHPAISDAAVIGIPDELWGETVKAYVVLKEGQTIDEQDVIDHCKRYLASYKKPKAVAFVSEIPKNPSGKVLKRVLRDQHEKGGGHS
jgi:fatty-acyl-CoA synthase